MENKTTKTNIKSLLFVFMLLVGVTLTTAQGIWSNPTLPPATKIVESPINAENDNQEKLGALITSGIINNNGDFISYANLYVGSGSYKTPAYLFGDTYFKKMTRTGATENRLCLSPEGEIKVCNNVSFNALAPVYYTQNNVTKFPTSTGVTGYVSYKIAQNESCTSSNLSNTDWGGRTLVGVESKVAVKFSDWGTYDLKMTCDGIEYIATIKVGGKILPTTPNTAIKYTLDLGVDRPAYVQVIGAGGGASVQTFQTTSGGPVGVCVSATIGGNTNVKIGSTTIASVNGGKGAQTGPATSCPRKLGTGGTVAINSLSSAYSNNGYDGENFVGGCNGKPDSNNDLNSCALNPRGTITPYGRGGSGKTYYDSSTLRGDAGGGGGAYAAGNYTLPATGTLTAFVGAAGGKGGNTPEGENGYISIEW